MVSRTVVDLLGVPPADRLTSPLAVLVEPVGVPGDAGPSAYEAAMALAAARPAQIAPSM